jgi:PhnB protein
MTVKPIPDGYHAVTPYLVVTDAAAALEFYAKVFGASEFLRIPSPDGKVAHAEVRIGGSVVMIADESPESTIKSPQTLGGSASLVHLYVPDVDAVAAKAVAAGAKMLIPVADQFYGDRAGRLQDPFGHVWIVSTHVKDVSPEEMVAQSSM